MGTLTAHPTFPAMKLLASDGGCHCGTHLALHNRKLRKLRKQWFKQIQAVSELYGLPLNHCPARACPIPLPLRFLQLHYQVPIGCLAGSHMQRSKYWHPEHAVT